MTMTSMTPIAYLKNFVSDDMLKEIISCTNKCIETKKITFKGEKIAQITSEKDMKAVIDFLYFAGVFIGGRQNICEL